MRRLLVVSLLVVSLLAVAACKGGGGATPPDAGTAPVGFRSCGTAAGVCTCVPIDVDPGPTATRACAASDCCFTDGDGRCTCRYPAAALDCTALRAALGGTTTVKACPR